LAESISLNLTLVKCNLGKGLQGGDNCVISPQTLIDSGLDVRGILQELAREAQAGNGMGNLKQGQRRDKQEN